jgi:hypothetical protein
MVLASSPTAAESDGWDDVFFPVHFPEQSYTVTEVCLDGDDGGSDCCEDDEIHCDEDGNIIKNGPRPKTTCVVRCDDNSIWSDVTDGEPGSNRTGKHGSSSSVHWRESDDRPFVPPDNIVFVRRHVQFRFQV